MKVFSMYIRLPILGRLISLICRGKSGHLFREKPFSFAPDFIPSLGLNPISSAVVSGKVLHSSAFGRAEFGKMHTERQADDDRVFRLQAHDSA